MINFVRETTELNQLSNRYHYCVSLSDSYQSFWAKNEDTITEIINRQQFILLNQKNNPKAYDIDKAITDYKKELYARYLLWSKAFSINKAYRLCHEDKSILTFSHRIDGWSNPVYQLTTNFSVEIKTNFGYGRASYFYTKLKYKNIDITPFSEWIHYEFAKFSEIVRYTQSHTLRNEYWLEAMEFSKDACNLSMIDEVKFVEKYVIDECEVMVRGLEDIFNKEHFSFKARENNNRDKVDKSGHVLVEFRGEKISGSLDFISKILEFEKIASIKSFVYRIEECNKRIQPILLEESKILKLKILNLTNEKNALEPNYRKFLEDNNNYNKKRAELQQQMNNSGIDSFNLDNEFNKKYPDYKEFQKEYINVTETYKILTDQIQNFTTVHNNIVSYNEKIKQYFGK